MIEPFLAAVQGGDEQRVHALLAENPELASARDTHGVSAVSLAMYNRRPEIARILIDSGAALDIFDASAAGELATVRKFLREDPDLANSWSPDGFTPLALAAFFGRRELVELLLHHGADVDAQARNAMQVAAIHAAAARNDASIVRTLLEHGANVNARQQGGFTALDAARQNRNSEMIELLLDHGAVSTAGMAGA